MNLPRNEFKLISQRVLPQLVLNFSLWSTKNYRTSSTRHTKLLYGFRLWNLWNIRSWPKYSYTNLQHNLCEKLSDAKNWTRSCQPLTLVWCLLLCFFPSAFMNGMLWMLGKFLWIMWCLWMRKDIIWYKRNVEQETVER